MRTILNGFTEEVDEKARTGEMDLGFPARLALEHPWVWSEEKGGRMKCIMISSSLPRWR